MPNFLDLPLEIRLHIYREIQLPQQKPISLGRHFAAEAAYNCPPLVFQISHQVSQEARMAFSTTSKRPWKIHVTASADAQLSLPDVLPDGLAQAAHIQFNFEFPRQRDILATMAHSQFDLLNLIQSQQRMIMLFLAVHQVGCGIDEICRRIAHVPVKRDLEICWSDHDEVMDLETKKTVLQPFSILRKSCSFRLGKVSAWQDDSGQELASYLEVVTGPVPILKDLRSQS